MKNVKVYLDQNGQLYVGYETFISILPKEMLPYRVEQKKFSKEVDAKLRSMKSESAVYLDYLQLNQKQFMFEISAEELFTGEKGLLNVTISNV